MTSSDKPQRPASLAALIRAARSTYALAIHAALEEEGFDDLPRDGVFAISAISRSDFSPGDLGRRHGVTKQAISLLLDSLVLRHYVERTIDPTDRRRMKLTLTERGLRVAALTRKAADRIEQRVAEIVGKSYVEHTRATLTALIELASEFDRSPRTATGG